MQERQYRYHVFLSHNNIQKDWVRDLAFRLRGAHLSVFFDEDSIELGEDIVTAIESAIRASRHILFVLSPDAVASKWVALELSTSLYRDPNAAARTIIPILREECEIPLTIARLKYLDARSDDLSSQVGRLLRAIESVTIETLTQTAKMIKSSPEIHRLASDSDASFRVGGTIPSSSTVYVLRDADRLVNGNFILQNSLCTIWGGRQMGKSSMLVRAISFAQQQGMKTAIIDLSALGGESLPKVLLEIAHVISRQVDGNEPSAKRFLNPVIHKMEFIDYVIGCGPGLVLAFDEVDYLRSIGEMESFFQLIRYLYNRLAIEPGMDIRLLISSFLSPRKFISDANSSPFNVGEIVHLRMFLLEEAQRLFKCGKADVSTTDMQALFSLTGGQPYLTHVTAKLLSDGISASQILQSVNDRNGPFSMHLDTLRSHVTQSPEALKSLNKYISGQHVQKDDLIELEELNILDIHGDHVGFSCGLYESFFTSSA